MVSHPFLSQTYEAAAAGNEHALYELGVMSGKSKYYENFKRDIEKGNQMLRDLWEKFDGCIGLSRVLVADVFDE
jgi:hypothetical protein